MINMSVSFSVNRLALKKNESLNDSITQPEEVKGTIQPDLWLFV